MELRTPYNYDRDEVSKNTALVCEDESLAQQNMKAETDLNVMIRKYGVLPAQEVNWKEFDATVIPRDYHELQNIMKEAQKQNPSVLSDRFHQQDSDRIQFQALLASNQMPQQELHLLEALQLRGCLQEHPQKTE